MSYAKLTRDEIAKRIALDIPEGAYVNLGIGMPTLVGNHLPKGREIFLHSENGILGMGPAPAAVLEGAVMIDGGKKRASLLPRRPSVPPTPEFARERRRALRHG